MPLRSSPGDGTGMNVPHVSCPTPFAFSKGPPKQIVRGIQMKQHSKAVADSDIHQAAALAQVREPCKLFGHVCYLCLRASPWGHSTLVHC